MKVLYAGALVELFFFVIATHERSFKSKIKNIGYTVKDMNFSKLGNIPLDMYMLMTLQ